MASNSNISQTAWITAYRRSFSDIPYAKDIFRIVDEMWEESGPAPIPEDIKQPEWAGLSEARFKMVDRLIIEQNPRQILEIAAGFSSRGLIFGSKKITYVEFDLPEITKNKSQMVTAIASKNGIDASTLSIESGDALSRDDLNNVCAHFDESTPLVIVSEGLLGYLSFADKEILANNIKSVLHRFGGVWITPDIVWPQEKIKPGYMESLDKIINVPVSQNRFESTEAAKLFFERLGFVVESRSFTEVASQLTSPKMTHQTERSTLELVGDSMAFVLKIR